MKNYAMGIDLGTSSVRAILFDPEGRPFCKAARECSIVTTSQGFAESDPEAILQAVFEVVKSCSDKAGAGNICAVGISSQMHSLMALDGDGRPLTKLMTWADTRAVSEANFIERNYDVKELYYKTGCRVQHPMYPLSKMLWLKGHCPELYQKAAKFITIKEYLLFRLFGVYVVDRTLASCQGYYNINTQQWDEELLRDLLKIDRSKLSEVVDCTHVLRGFDKSYEALLGLHADTPFVPGSGDGILANVGSGVFDDTAFTTTVGTSGAVRTTVASPLLDKEGRTWCYSFTRDRWVAGGAINSGGIALKWLRDEFRDQFERDAAAEGLDSLYKLFDSYAEQIPPASDGLVFLPYLTGERSPDWNAGARGILFGLSYHHTRKHMIRAAMEGVIYRLFSVYRVLTAISDNADRIYANSGYTNSPLWLQMQADIFNKEIQVSEVTETSALGAAILARAGAAGESFTRRLPVMEPVRVITPNPESVAIYQRAYEQAQEIYNRLYHPDKALKGEL